MRWILIGLVMTLAACSSVPTSFTPVNPLSAGDFAHGLLGQVLAAHVKDGVVDYPSIQENDRLAAYLAQLDRVDPNALPTRQDRLAFWVNAYNACAIKGILDQYSPRSYVGRYRYFIGRDYRIGGALLNLYDLERHVLIKQFQEPRIHFAIVCASASCPKLQSWVYEPGRLEDQLDRVATAFINDPMKNRFDRRGKIASLSMIFKWFEKDFSMSAGSVLAYVARYIDDPDLAQELVQPGYRIEFLEYDWSLNGTPPKERDHAGTS